MVALHYQYFNFVILDRHFYFTDSPTNMAISFGKVLDMVKNLRPQQQVMTELSETTIDGLQM